MYGHEIMFFVATDGKGGTILPIGTALDFKRAFDPGDPRIKSYFDGINPNTGGMLSISPNPHEEEFRDRIMNEIAIPTIKKFQEETGYEYLGIGYFGIMLSQEDGELVPRIEEFNRRWGDPELESIGPRIKTDYYKIADQIIERRLHEIGTAEFEPFLCYALVAVSGNTMIRRRGTWDSPEYKAYMGYPGEHLTNQPISGLRNIDSSVIIYHNGTAFHRDKQNDPDSIHPERGNEDRNIDTSGGRVLTLVVKADNLQDAKRMAEDNMGRISFTGIRYRRKIDEEETMIRPR
jgi:phosphoribosylamine--glycine ligase